MILRTQEAQVPITLKNFEGLADLLNSGFPKAKVYLFSIIPKRYKDEGHPHREKDETPS